MAEITPSRITTVGVPVLTGCILFLIYLVNIFMVFPWYVTNKGTARAFYVLNGFATYEISMLFANWFLFLVTAGHFRRILRIFGIGGPLWRTNRVTEVEAAASRSTTYVGYCSACDQTQPERAHHCPFCDMCIKKRDHHCYFLGSCVGFYNERFFIVFCFHAAVAGTFSLTMFIIYLYSTFNGYFTFARAALLMPPLALGAGLMGKAPFDFYTLICLGGFHLGGIIGGSLFCCFQLYLVIRGQTSHEYSSNSTSYDAGLVKNFKSVFGRFGLLNFLLPLPALRNSHEYNGLSWAFVKGRYYD